MRKAVVVWCAWPLDLEGVKPRYPHIPSYIRIYRHIHAYTRMYIKQFHIRNMRANIRPKNDHVWSPRPFLKVRI